MIPIITIQGPTAVGKSSLAFELAQKINSDIISADSRQVYKLMNIGTAKPDKKELNKVKHHLVNIIYPDQKYSAGDFVRDSEKTINKLNKRNKIPIIAGGTGFYIKALLKGIFQSPKIPNSIKQHFQKVLKDKGKKELYFLLSKVDPQSAKRIHPNDVQRILRALEVWKYTGKNLTSHWKAQKTKKKYKSLNILLYRERNSLYEKINNRVDKMIENGLIEEFKSLVEKGYSQEDPGMNTVGYKELFPLLESEKELINCIEKIKKHTRNYAKRQLTWYRKTKFDLTFEINELTILEMTSQIIEHFNKKIGDYNDGCQSK